MTLYKQGSVILVPFPFTDFSTIKQRPAVVISSTQFNRSSDDIILAAITSHLQVKSLYDIHLNKTDQHHAGLPKPSVVKCGKIATVDKRLIRKQLGQLSTSTTKLILEKIHSTITSS